MLGFIAILRREYTYSGGNDPSGFVHVGGVRRVARRTQKWHTGFPMEIHVYGDATGEQHRTSSSRTDWQIVKDFFGRYTSRGPGRHPNRPPKPFTRWTHGFLGWRERKSIKIRVLRKNSEQYAATAVRACDPEQLCATWMAG